MNFVKNFWTDVDIKEYRDYSKTLKSNPHDCAWEKRVVNTNLECFGKTSQKAKEIAKQISKGNAINFIEDIKIENMLDSLVVAFLLNKIKEFNIFTKLLTAYVQTIDNWASADSLRFNKHKKEELIKLANKFLKNKKPFIRRVGVNIFFELIKDKNYLSKTFEMLDFLKEENEYYVNMCAAWLLSVCFVKYREETLNYITKANATNNFIINKGISKCRDSYRVSKEDKDLLKQFKKELVKN